MLMNRNEKALMRKLSREGRVEDFEQEKEAMEANLNHYGLVKEEPKEEVKKAPKKVTARRTTKVKKEDVVEDVKDAEDK